MKQMQRHKEQGAFLIFMAVSLFAVLAVIGLGIDLGFLYRTEKLWQNALDAGAIKGIRLAQDATISSAFDDPPGDPELEGFITDLVIEHLRQRNFSEEVIQDAQDNLEITVNVNGGVRDRVTVEGPIFQPTMFLGKIPGFGDGTTIPRLAEAEFSPTRVCLVLDASNSASASDMPCEGEDFRNPNNCNSDNTAARIDSIKETAVNFINRLSPFDRLCVVSFNANVIHEWPVGIPFAQLTPDNRTAAIAAIDDIVLGGGTNPGGGLALATNLFATDLNNSSLGQFRNRIILLTDGKPEYTGFDQVRRDCPPVSGTANNWFRQGVVDSVYEADIARGDIPGLTIFTIGVGEEDPLITTEWQTEDQRTVKNLSLIRIANDQRLMRAPWEELGFPVCGVTEAMVQNNPSENFYPCDYPNDGYSPPNPTPNPGGTPNPTPTPGGSTCVASGTQIQDRASGRYAFAQDVDQLNEVYSAIANTLGPRLVR